MVEFKVRYRNETHGFRENTTDWSLAGRNTEFRPAYAITEGKDINLSYIIRLGEPIDCCPRTFQANLSYAHGQTLPESEFDYTRNDVVMESYLPLHRRVGLHLKARTGTLDGPEGGYGLQHQVLMGGVGSIQGYDYKDLNGDGIMESGSHYAVINTDFLLWKRRSLLGLSWHFGGVWDSNDQLLTGNYLDNLQEHGYHSLGVSLGGEDVRLEYFRPLTRDDEWIFYLRLAQF